MAAILSPPALAIWTWPECKLRTKLNINHNSSSNLAFFFWCVFWQAVSCFVYCFNNVILSVPILDTNAKQSRKIENVRMLSAFLHSSRHVICNTDVPHNPIILYHNFSTMEQFIFFIFWLQLRGRFSGETFLVCWRHNFGIYMEVLKKNTKNLLI
jgi:hypothetical protein